MGAKVVVDGQVLVVAEYLTSAEVLFLQSPERYAPDSNLRCRAGGFVMEMPITELEAATGRTWVGVYGIVPQAMKSYTSLETALVALSKKVGHRIAQFGSKFYVAPIQSDFEVDPDWPSGFILLDGERYINEEVC